MITIDKIDVYGWESAIRGMRNPMNSWANSDTEHFCNCGYSCTDCEHAGGIGEKDLALMKKLVQAGTDHSKFMRMITVTCDIIAPLYFLKELDTYKVGTVRNSCSTMHKITEKEFTLNDFSWEHLFPAAQEHLKETIERLNYYRDSYLKFDELNEASKNFFQYGEVNKKNMWWQLIQLLPSSYNQQTTWQANYAVLRNIYHARKNHKLDEWKAFCKFIEELPYSELITFDKNDLSDVSDSNKISQKEEESQQSATEKVVKKDCIYYQKEGVSRDKEYCSYNGHPLDSHNFTCENCSSCSKYLTLAQMIEIYNKGE